jgi:hypothetical protein
MAHEYRRFGGTYCLSTLKMKTLISIEWGLCCLFDSRPTQRRIVVSYRRFWTTYRYRSQGSSSIGDRTDRFRNVGKKLQFYSANSSERLQVTFTSRREPEIPSNGFIHLREQMLRLYRRQVLDCVEGTFRIWIYFITVLKVEGKIWLLPVQQYGTALQQCRVIVGLNDRLVQPTDLGGWVCATYSPGFCHISRFKIVINTMKMMCTASNVSEWVSVVTSENRIADR